MARFPLQDLRRRISHYRSEAPGPTLLCIGSMHGNEPAGYQSLHRVHYALASAAAEEGFGLHRGEWIGIGGNLQALERELRFVDRDLNRGWRRETIEQMRSDGPTSVEDIEMLAIFDLIEVIAKESRGPLYFIDLHTTSGESPPFASIANTSTNQEFIQDLTVPTVLGMEKYLDGTLLECLHDHDFSGVIFEGGQHDAPGSVDHCEAALWLGMDKLDLFGPRPPRELSEHVGWSRGILQRFGESLPHMVEIEYRYDISLDAHFRMEPGFESFQQVRKGEILARDDNGLIVAPSDARLLMPLYQMQGDDGFFLVRELETQSGDRPGSGRSRDGWLQVGSKDPAELVPTAT